MDTPAPAVKEAENALQTPPWRGRLSDQLLLKLIRKDWSEPTRTVPISVQMVCAYV